MLKEAEPMENPTGQGEDQLRLVKAVDVALPVPMGAGPVGETQPSTAVKASTAGSPVQSKESPLDRMNPQIREYLLQRFNEAQLALLLQKTPRREVRTRLLNPSKPEGPGNPRLKYVEHAYVTETLNLLFGFNWDLEVLDH